MRPYEDHHVHSTFGYGEADPASILRAAEKQGMTLVGFGDHVTQDTDWLDDYVHFLELMRVFTRIRVIIGVQTRVLNAAGELDLPELPDEVERVIIVNNRLHLPFGSYGVNEVKLALFQGALSEEEVAEGYVRSLTNAVLNSPRASLVRRPFDFLKQVGVSWPTNSGAVDSLISACRRTHTVFQQECMPPAFQQRLVNAGVALVPCTNSVESRSVGDFSAAPTLMDCRAAA